MIKLNLHISNLNIQERNHAFKVMHAECVNTWVEPAFVRAWKDFEDGKFKYDGATFVQERNDEFFECAAFIHDWLNALGYVGKKPDLFFIKIMITLGYHERLIFERSKWMQWTFLNKLWHKIKGTYVADEVPNIY